MLALRACGLLLIEESSVVALVLSFAALTVFRPAGLRGSAQDHAPLLRTDVTPSGRCEAEGCSPNGRRGELPTGEVHDFERQIEHGFRRESRLAHDSTQSGRSSGPEQPPEFGRHEVV
jgi:hypothetical protein